jgi:hypothetical protein
MGRPLARQRRAASAPLQDRRGAARLRRGRLGWRREAAELDAERLSDRSQENEAYDLGAALLLPKERIQRDVKDEKLAAIEIADAHKCSEQLVVYRIRRMRLWDRYKAYAPSP